MMNEQLNDIVKRRKSFLIAERSINAWLLPLICARTRCKQARVLRFEMINMFSCIFCTFGKFPLHPHVAAQIDVAMWQNPYQ
jgi:hypothetical protein